MPLIEVFEIQRTNAERAATTVHGSSKAPVPAYNHKNAAMPELTNTAGKRSKVAAVGPQSGRDRNSHPGICRIEPRISEKIPMATAAPALTGSENAVPSNST